MGSRSPVKKVNRTVDLADKEAVAKKNEADIKNTASESAATKSQAPKTKE